MTGVPTRWAQGWTRVGTRFLPFADAATHDLPLPRLMRLALFQVSVGMATALLVGTLNRVMIVELGMAASLVAAMVALPLLFAPFRALVGYRSDTHRSLLGWRRVPYLWLGTLVQFGGLSIMPFALLVLTGQGHGPAWVGHVGAALAFLLVGAGLQITQTAGLALATDLAGPASRPRVVALMYVMLLAGILVAGAAFSLLLADFSPLRLVQVIQGAAVATMVLNLVALWKQEPRGAARAQPDAARAPFAASWRSFAGRGSVRRFLVVVFVGTAAFNMQDVVLEPYGGEVLRLPVAATTALTALLAAGALLAFAVAARLLARATDPHRLAAYGLCIGLAAFAAVTLAAPLDSPTLFRAGTLLIGLGGGFFAVGTLVAAMDLEHDGRTGMVLGAWGAVQALAAGLAMGCGGVLRDVVAHLDAAAVLSTAPIGPLAGYGAVYVVELLLLFVALAALGPLVGHARRVRSPSTPATFGLAQFPR